METTKLIEEYLNGTLNESERKQFEKRITCDVEFNQLYELHKEVNESIRDKKFHQFHSLIQQAENSYFNSGHESMPVHPQNSTYRKKSMLRYAAVFLVLLGTAALLKLTLFSGAKSDRLFDRYYAAYNADMVMRSTQSEVTTLENAILEYSRRDYATALQKLNKLILENQENQLAWFYKGLTCLALDQPSEAIRSFRVIDPNWNHPLMEHRNWYLALALLHNNNRDEAVAVFSEIREFKGYYSENADRILRKLGS